jgi:two-component system response regulator PilR (NtrC family)
VKGAFTGAVQNKAGLFESADSGTLFLDEVGELTLPVQVKLMRAIQEKTFRRVGGTRDIRADVRIVAATNRKLEQEVASGRFRDDLYYRLNVIEIIVPPLRERPDDIPLLAAHFLEKYAVELDRQITPLTDEAIERLVDYRFPGNVRELENAMERAVALGRGPVIDVDALPPSITKPVSSEATARIPRTGIDLESMVDEYERGLLMEALRASGGVKKRAAQLVGVSFRSFRYRLEKLGLDNPDHGEI